MKSGRERLQQWIDRSELNQNEAAETLSVHHVVLSQILNGKRNPGLRTAVKIEEATGIPAKSWLLKTVSRSSRRASAAPETTTAFAK